MKNFLKELDLLELYMNIYIQLLPYCYEFGGNSIHKTQLPTYEYFKKTLNTEEYCLLKPNFIEGYILNKDLKFYKNHAHGLGQKRINDINRFYNIWMGCKYYPNENYWEVNTQSIFNKVNNILK